MNRNRVAAVLALLVLLALPGCKGAAKPTATATPGPSAQAKSTSPASASPASASPQPSGQAAVAAVPSVRPKITETPVPPDPKKTAAIPEAQSFMNYTSLTEHYDVQVPENWQAKASGANVQFTRGDNGVSIDIVDSTAAFSAQAIADNQVAAFIRDGRAVRVTSVRQVSTSSGPAVQVDYEYNSGPERSAGKIRLLGRRFYYPGTGKLAVLTLWGPAEADNENIWKQIPDTFVWR